MKKIFFASISSALLAAFFTAPALAEEAASLFVSTCAEWKSAIPINTEALDKLKKNAAGEKPASGLSYTKNQFVVLLGKNPVAAKDALANYKDKLPKTSEGKVDLKDVLLEGFNLAGMNFDNVDFKGAELNGADLSGASLRDTSLSNTELEGANLGNANLSYANLSNAKLADASLCHATLTSANLEDAEVLGAYLKGAKLDMAKNIPKAIYQNSVNVLQFGLPVPPGN